MVFDYIDGGADDEITRFENHTAFNDYRIAHRVLSGVDKPDMSTTIMGQKIDVHTALILTVDFPITGNRERDPRNGFTIPPKLGAKQIWHAMNAPLWSLDYVTKPSVKYANLADDTSAVSLNEFVAQQLSADFSWDDAMLFRYQIMGVVNSIVLLHLFIVFKRFAKLLEATLN